MKEWHQHEHLNEHGFVNPNKIVTRDHLRDMHNFTENLDTIDEFYAMHNKLHCLDRIYNGWGGEIQWDDGVPYIQEGDWRIDVTYNPPDPDELRWAEAQALYQALEAGGFICGHPYQEDATAVIRKLLEAGYKVSK